LREYKEKNNLQKEKPNVGFCTIRNGLQAYTRRLTGRHREKTMCQSVREDFFLPSADDLRHANSDQGFEMSPARLATSSRAIIRMAGLALTMLLTSSIAHAERGPRFSDVGKIVVVRSQRVETPPAVYLQTSQTRYLLICATAYQYGGSAVKVEGTFENGSVCADTITEVDPAVLEPKREHSTGPRPASYAEFCRFVGLPHGTFLCTPVMANAQGGLSFFESWSAEAILDPGRTDWQQFLVDVNGDRRPDYCRFVTRPSTNAPMLSCAVRTDAGFTDAAITTPPGLDLGYPEKPRFLADVDGDGRPDFCRFVGGAKSPTLSCALQRNDGYAGPELKSAAGLDTDQADKPSFMVDVNGDDRADYCRFVGATTLSCTLATADGFSGELKSAPGIDPGHPEMGRFMSDVNNDRKADFCRFIDAPETKTTRLSCLLADEHGIGPAVHQSEPLLPEPVFGATQGVNPGMGTGSRFLVDVNQDRMADYCRVVTIPRNPTMPFFACAIATRRGFGNYDIMGNINLGIDGLVHLMAPIR
jgi:hypothetical protein